MSFSATDAAFEGFRVARRNPLAILIWTVLYAVVAIGQMFAAGGMMQSMLSMTEMMEDMEASPPTTIEGWAPLMQAWGEMMGSVAWMLPMSMVLSAVLTAAVARAVLRPGEKAFGFVRLGMDEVRVFVVTLVIGILAAIFSMVVFFVAILGGAFALDAMGAWGGLVMALAIIAAIGLVIWMAVRWSLAIPITMAEKRIAIFDSFAVTKGRFWPLLGMALIAGVMAFLVMLLCSVVSAPISLMMGMDIWSSMGGPQAEDIVRMFDVRNPWVIASAVVDAFTYALVLGVCHAPFAAAYKAIKAG